MKAKLIFNPASGNPAESAVQLVELLRHLQTQQIQVEVVVVQPGHRLPAIARSAARAGAKMVIVSGGDGTIENVALGLVGSQTTLGIIPTGTRNRVASRAVSAFPPTHAISPTPSRSCVKDAGSKLTWGSEPLFLGSRVHRLGIGVVPVRR